MAKNFTPRGQRNNKGNFYVLYIGLAAALIVVWSLFTSVCLNWITSYRNKCALEAASLAASRELSRIVVDDPIWGYVGLADQAPVGDETRVRDGYPLPVTGANTILATARLELIVAHSIGTNEAIECAREDLESARAALRRLSRVLRNSLHEGKGTALQQTGTRLSGMPDAERNARGMNEHNDTARDIHGNEVHPLETAKAIYKRNASQLLSGLGWKLDNLTAELGWIETEGTTNTPIPGTENCTAVEDVLLHGKAYPAFTNVPAYGENFYFASMGKQAGLVESSFFRRFDVSRNCSIVRLSARLKRSDSSTIIESAACSQPAYIEDRIPASYMVLRLPDGIPANMNSLRDLLTSEHMLKLIPMYTAVGGDFPNEPGAVLKENPGKPVMTVRHAFTRAFFDWLRTAHSKSKVDSVVSALDYQFNRHHSSSAILVSIDDDGRITIDSPRSYPFTTQTAYEQQLYTVAFDAINTGGVSWTIRLRDQVHRLGKQHGGKHGGQPMPSIVAVDLNQDESKRELATAGSRYDRSRLALEVEICSPQSANVASIGGRL